MHRPREARTLLPANASLELQAWPTLDLLHEARYLQVTNPTDRIYAFMAIPTSDGAMPTLVPDYSDQTSYLDVYREFATRFLDATSNLDLLSYVDYKPSANLDDLFASPFPSWIPRWNHKSYSYVPLFYFPRITGAHDAAPVRSGSLLRVRRS